MKQITKDGTPLVSAVIITYNESANIRKTLSQLYWCDEIIIVDSFSTDGTDSIAREQNCRLLQRAFSGFGDQKRFAISQCKNEWVLCLDADEFLTNELVEEICKALQNPGDSAAYSFPSKLVFRKQPFGFGRESNRQVTKLFNRRFGQMSIDRVHEKIEVNGNIKRLNSPLLHYSYRDINQYFLKFDRYTDWCAEDYFVNGKRRSRSLILISVPYYFFKYYIIDRNMLNGVNGFYWSALMAFYHFVKYIKLEDMYQTGACLSPVTGKTFKILDTLYKRNPFFTGNAGTF
jgi:glycosyltransferase involved in cell wall biosynthesis